MQVEIKRFENQGDNQIYISKTIRFSFENSQSSQK